MPFTWPLGRDGAWHSRDSEGWVIREGNPQEREGLLRGEGAEEAASKRSVAEMASAAGGEGCRLGAGRRCCMAPPRLFLFLVSSSTCRYVSRQSERAHASFLQSPKSRSSTERSPHAVNGDLFRVCASHYSISSLRQGLVTGTSPGASAGCRVDGHTAERRAGANADVWQRAGSLERRLRTSSNSLMGYSLRMWPWKGNGVRTTDELQL